RKEKMRSMPFQRSWLRLLGLGEYFIYYTKVNPRIVFDTDKGRMNNLYIGVMIDHERKIVQLYHTRKISEIDLVHELIHPLNPQIAHEHIDPLCERLIAARKRGTAKRMIRRYSLGLRTT
ncbi:hypothetical protein IH981_02475, partial [Patescibacteria group bacterium]|nr:hypothetical protein [Patescibacteria group bacterium]